MGSIDRRSFLKLSGAVSAAAIVAACGGGSSSSRDGAGPAATLRLGYFPNMTHVQPNVAVELGTFTRFLGEEVNLKTKLFNAGPSVIEAMLAGDLDAAYVGPSPTINGYVQSDGKELRVIAGATSGGALFVVRPSANIARPSDFARTRLATPQLANTQDVAVRAWLRTNGLAAREQGGNVNVLPASNADTLTLFKKGDVDGAWVPEPWATRLVQEAGGRVYLDERSLWPNGDFVTTQLIVRTRFLAANSTVIEKLLRAHVDVTRYINDNPDEARLVLNRAIERASQAPLPQTVIDAAWEHQRITFDPIATSLKKTADDSYALGFLQSRPDLSRLYDLTLLNKVLSEQNEPPVTGLG